MIRRQIQPALAEAVQKTTPGVSTRRRIRQAPAEAGKVLAPAEVATDKVQVALSERKSGLLHEW